MDVLQILQVVAWIGTAVGALIAAFSLRITARQARANFLLSLNPLWNDLKDARHEMILLSKEVTKSLGASPHALAKDADRLKALREEYKKQVEVLEKSADGDK